jgi:hypothetical protein
VGKRGFWPNIKKVMGLNHQKAWELDGSLENISVGVRRCTYWFPRDGTLGMSG